MVRKQVSGWSQAHPLAVEEIARASVRAMAPLWDEAKTLAWGVTATSAPKVRAL